MEKYQNKQHNKYICNNCSITGHLFYNCRKPITSFGIICFRINNNKLEYLMVMRKDSLGYVDFIRGKYNEKNTYHLENIINEMTITERKLILDNDYDFLWNKLWDKTNNKYDLKNEEKFYYVKKNNIDLFKKKGWKDPEWGFPKGRRNYKERDLDCGLREWEEETGYKKRDICLIKNVGTVEEIFTGSNFKSYKHKYYMGLMDYNKSLDDTRYQKSEIGDMKWFSYEDCISNIRFYNIEKISLFNNVNNLLLKNRIW